MPGNSPTHRPAAGGLLIALLLVGCLIPAVSAVTIYDETYTENYADFITMRKEHANGAAIQPAGLFMTKPLACPEFKQLFIVTPTSITPNYASLPNSAQTTVKVYNSSISNNNGAFYGTGTLGYFKFKSGSTNYLQTWFEMDPDANYDIITGQTYLKFVKDDPDFLYPLLGGGTYAGGLEFMFNYAVTSSPGYHVEFGTVGGSYFRDIQYVTNNIFLEGHWENRLIVDSIDSYYNNRSNIQIIREFPDAKYTSNSYVEFGDTVYSSLTSNDNIDYYVNAENYPFEVNIKSIVGTWYNQTFYTDTPGETPINPPGASATVYVQSSQTGALLANANLAILASAGGTETEIINATLPGGVGTYPLQPTGGGLPNPDYYRAVATVPGFTQIVENHSFTLNGPHDVIIEMRPDTGGPLDPDRAYLEYYVRDIHANPISSASVQCDGRIKTTNSQGYAVFEVSKNATYPYTVKKTNYVTIEGTATVADGPRYVANVVLGPGSVPTHTPTPGPGETPGGPGATPTPDRRTNEEKGQSIIDMIADNAEPLVALALLGTFLGLFKLMAKW